jgi:hypothetical protein
MFTEPDWRNSRSIMKKIPVGKGTIIRENVIINLPAENSEASIGKNCYIMNTSFIGHDCILRDCVTLCPHACVAGHVYIGEYSIIGMNASVHQGSVIGKCCMIGAGSFFKGNSIDGITWGGVPARPLKVNTIGIERSGLPDSEKEEITLLAEAFIDTIKSSGNVQTKDWISSAYDKTIDIVHYCIKFFNLSDIFNKKFRLRVPSD